MSDSQKRPFEPAHPSPERALELLRAIAHPVRAKILRTMMFGEPMRVSDVAAAVEEPANSVSYHLRQLARAGITRTTEPEDAHDRRETWWVVDDWSGVSIDPGAIRSLPGGGAVLSALDTADASDLADVFSMARAEAAERAGLPALRGDGPLLLTEAEARALVEAVSSLSERARARSREHADAHDADVGRYDLRVAIMPRTQRPED
ncbi:HTH_20 multi-domain protein [Acidipropionibacterium acidipropionici ATCC 4875]|uniref:HTH_20 multi-domain protein n=1 Tax=Acidipropionibacterium acidipropionici (strain ATCC 4875 / DSM 20272 / JCM 6432 / NBRC 12425 / NCIMB 8070 / 4) TaxID=1171373 RepID=K7RMS1_ACIA4|nr:helix-turn-helix domain-containing protein [Acidipropionibacterium acidipropionici]AFV89244.1 HTH_20 multi-domain protein [Acidipropionibacterium acidipropionici ATCC 4875]MDN6556253.1 helix-turn-helix domain-containing protein [Acidipropionibacterium acidipropionici]